MIESTTPDATSEVNDGKEAAKRKRDMQNKKITNYVREAETFLTTLQGDPALKAAAAAHGYEEADLAEGIEFLTQAGGSLQQRQQGLGEKTTEQDDLELTETEARSAYAAFRLIARATFPADGDRIALGLKGDVPEDMDRFVTLATTSYTNAGTPAYAAKMTKRNYAPTRLAELLAGLKKLTGDESDRDTASGGAVEDTKARDEAYDSLRAWMKELKGVMRGALKGQEGHLSKLKL